MHTPLKVGERYVTVPFPTGVAEIKDGTGYAVAFVPLHWGSRRNEDREQWPEQIVEAVNAYETLKAQRDELLDSLREILSYNGGSESALDDEYVMECAAPPPPTRSNHCQRPPAKAGGLPLNYAIRYAIRDVRPVDDWPDSECSEPR